MCNTSTRIIEYQVQKKLQECETAHNIKLSFYLTEKGGTPLPLNGRSVAKKWTESSWFSWFKLGVEKVIMKTVFLFHWIHFPFHAYKKTYT